MREKVVTIGIELVAVGGASIQKAQKRVAACQSCSASVSRPFSSIIIEVLGAAGPISEYVLCAPARCPNCAQPIVENTLVRCEGELEDDAPNAPLDFGRCWDENNNVVLINEAILSEAQASISGCEHCDASAGIAFDYILDAVTKCESTITEYVMCRAAKCPRCHHEVTEKTLVAAFDLEH
jgi:hypothetical protein